ncbi:MAG: tetratricopeptide repeat protein [Planctomycetes bacterium]|nr:tetratricopeptide repeat protein [Planctomycetota bacterium]
MSLFRFRNVIGATLAVALLLGAGGCNSFSRRPAEAPLYKGPGIVSPAAVDPRQTSHNEPDDKSGYLFEEDSDVDGPSAAPKSASGFKAFSPSSISSKIKGYFQPTRSRERARQLFDEAEQAFDAERYDKAIDLYSQTRKRWPRSALEHDAMFQIGESYYKSHRYPKANEAYKELLKKYKNSRYLEKVVARQFTIARYWEQLEAWRPGSWYAVNLTDFSRPTRDAAGKARATYSAVYLNDPTGPLADDAIMAVGNHHFVRGAYDKADHQYSLLRTDHPKSEHVYQAYLLGIQVKMKTYQGPDYNGTPLDEAQELLDQLKLQFADRIGRDEQQRLEHVHQEIRRQKALRDWHLAQYYEARKDFRAARSYYEKIKADYPTNTIAGRAQQQIDKIAGEPDNAPDYVPWLTRIFEPHERRR